MTSVAIHESGCDLGCNVVVLHGLAPQRGFGQRGQARRPDKIDRTAAREAADEVARIVAFDRAGRR